MITCIFCPFACLRGNAYVQNFNCFCFIKPSPDIFQVVREVLLYLFINNHISICKATPLEIFNAAAARLFLRTAPAFRNSWTPVLPSSGAGRPLHSSDSPFLTQPQAEQPLPHIRLPAKSP